LVTGISDRRPRITVVGALGVERVFFSNIDDARRDGIPKWDLGGPIVGTSEITYLKVMLNEPQAFIALEDWPSGSESNWAFWHDEIHLVLDGEAEITYTLPPNHTKVQSRNCGKGSVYIILAGTRARWRVVSETPYSHMCFVMPRYEYDKRLLREES
jgi:hypothetical protein